MTPEIEKLRKLDKKGLKKAAASIRRFLIEKVSKTGGHLSSNLGSVELTIALVRTFDFPKDKIIFDVGHQAYTYKLLTGRKDGFDHLREYGGMSGFPKCNESEYDSFDTGHSSTSISAGVGMVRARELEHGDHYVVSVIGDGSMTGGEAYEALNNAALLRSNFIIILNDNNMSISGNVGGFRNYLATIRSGKGYNRMKKGVKRSLGVTDFGSRIVDFIGNAMDSVKELVVPGGMLFENLGITYLGPVDGHDVIAMEKLLRRAKELDQPVLIHVMTKKGKGYRPAEEMPMKFHGIGPFDPVNGEERCRHGRTYSDVFGEFALEQAENDPKCVAITAAMGPSVGLLRFSERYPKRYFDVGIAEQHAVTFAAGLARAGMHPAVAVFSSFLQRSYDQIVQDVCMQNLPVVFSIDRAGLVGQDGETHQGAFDVAYLLPIPNVVIMAPKSGTELKEMLRLAFAVGGPSAIRYPRGTASEYPDFPETPVELGKAEVLKEGNDVALLALGDMVATAVKTASLLSEEGIDPTVVNLRFVKPFDEALILNLLKTHRLLVTLEDGAVIGGIGERIAAFSNAGSHGVKVLTLGLPDRFIPQGSVPELMKSVGLDETSVKERIMRELER